LIEGSAIQLHPLVTTAFNADFDGDQMAVHVPLSDKAVKEARELMLSTKNLLKPANGEPIIAPSKDMVMGVYFLTKEDDRPYPGAGRAFSTMIEVETAYQLDQVKIPTKIKLLAETWYDDAGERMAAPEERVIETTVGRTIFNLALPYEVQFMNWSLVKGDVKDLISEIYEYCDNDTTTQAADKIKDLGFEFATKSGYSIAVADLQIPPEKEAIVAEALERVGEVERSFRRGLLTAQEQDDRVIDIWQKTTSVVGDAVKANMDPHGNMAVMALSGATKGGFGPVSQLAGMRGLMADPSGQIIPLPIRSSFREGLTALEYFISSHGARKGLADTALRTADAGYLTRRLVDVSQDAIINADDCGTSNSIMLERSEDVAGQTLQDRVFSRVLADHVVDQETGEVLVEKNTLVSREIARNIQKSNVDKVRVFSPLTCELEYGLCAKCYGLDLGRGQPVEKGATVGIVAAQSIGEPGTQLTLRTFHTGGVAAASDITTGLPRVEELFEARKAPKGEAVLTEIAGRVSIEKSDRYSDMRVVRVTHSEMISDAYELEKNWRKRVKDEDQVEEGDVIASLDADNKILAKNKGRVRIEDRTIIVSYEVREEKYYEIPSNSRLAVEDGEMVDPAQRLTEGSLNTHDILRISGRDACQKYMLTEVQSVYRSQGQNIHDKHFEIVIAKMMSRVNVTDSGDSETLPRELTNRVGVMQENEELLQQGKRPLKYNDVLLGITKAALSTDSFLAAASFQHTIKILTQAAVNRDEDPLFGLKENVIIGKLIPAGTGFIRGPFAPEDEIVIGDEKDAEVADTEAKIDLGEISEETVIEDLESEIVEEE
jgi:DNA-directed RNA polymerase subunit beta'